MDTESAMGIDKDEFGLRARLWEAFDQIFILKKIELILLKS